MEGREGHVENPGGGPLDTVMASVALMEDQLIRNTVAHNRSGTSSLCSVVISFSVPGMTA